jgi:hypothetical protein
MVTPKILALLGLALDIIDACIIWRYPVTAEPLERIKEGIYEFGQATRPWLIKRLRLQRWGVGLLILGFGLQLLGNVPW